MQLSLALLLATAFSVANGAVMSTSPAPTYCQLYTDPAGTLVPKPETIPKAAAVTVRFPEKAGSDDVEFAPNYMCEWTLSPSATVADQPEAGSRVCLKQWGKCCLNAVAFFPHRQSFKSSNGVSLAASCKIFFFK